MKQPGTVAHTCDSTVDAEAGEWQLVGNWGRREEKGDEHESVSVVFWGHLKLCMAGKVARPVKVLPTHSDVPSSVPGSHMVEGWNVEGCRQSQVHAVLHGCTCTNSIKRDK